jgi:hypothetical protein
MMSIATAKFILLLLSMLKLSGAWMISSSPMLSTKTTTLSLRINNGVSSSLFSRCIPRRISSSRLLLSDADYVTPLDVSSSPLLVATVALVLGIAAQSFINQMLQGDQGLGAFLKDGRGYNRSGFRYQEGEKSDPLPWLKLPKFDFVEVAGQENEILAYQRMEEMRVRMNQQLRQGNVVEATTLREELERFMEEAGIEFKITDGEP